jgi:hypothetical protein
MRNQTLRVINIRLFAILILGLTTFKSVAQNLFYNNTNLPVNIFQHPTIEEILLNYKQLITMTLLRLIY